MQSTSLKAPTNLAAHRRELKERQRLSLAHRLSGLDPRRLLYLHEAVATGSMRAGAERLNTSTSALSRQIKKLETDLQIVLLERRGRGVRPTEAGAMLLGFFSEQRATLDGIVTQLQDLSAMREGFVSLALGEGFLSEVMTTSLQVFAETHPGIRVEVFVGSTEELVRRVIEDESHVALIYHPPADARLQSHAARPHPLCAVTRPDHPLAALHRPVTLDDLAAYDVGLLPGSSGVRQLLLSAEQRDHKRLVARLTSNSTKALLWFAEKWNGVALTTAFSVADEIGNGRLVAIEFEDRFFESAEVHLVTRRGRQLATAPARLLRSLKSNLAMISQP